MSHQKGQMVCVHKINILMYMCTCMFIDRRKRPNFDSECTAYIIHKKYKYNILSNHFVLHYSGDLSFFNFIKQNHFLEIRLYILYKNNICDGFKNHFFPITNLII